MVLTLPDEAFRAIGAAFHRTALQAAATAYQEHAEEWKGLAPDDLVKALDDIPRVGPWTASAATADFTGDFSVYPHGDLAVRTWARRAAPDAALPDDERAFAAAWQRSAPDRPQLHALTLFTLAWGTHARTAEHDGAPADRT
jgi:DNA-3-methyladenine glycosylase II